MEIGRQDALLSLVSFAQVLYMPALAPDAPTTSDRNNASFRRMQVNV